MCRLAAIAIAFTCVAPHSRAQADGSGHTHEITGSHVLTPLSLVTSPNVKGISGAREAYDSSQPNVPADQDKTVRTPPIDTTATEDAFAIAVARARDPVKQRCLEYLQKWAPAADKSSPNITAEFLEQNVELALAARNLTVWGRYGRACVG